MCVRQRQYGSLDRNEVLVTKADHVIMPPAASTDEIRDERDSIAPKLMSDSLAPEVATTRPEQAKHACFLSRQNGHLMDAASPGLLGQPLRQTRISSVQVPENFVHENRRVIHDIG